MRKLRIITSLFKYKNFTQFVKLTTKGDCFIKWKQLNWRTTSSINTNCSWLKLFYSQMIKTLRNIYFSFPCQLLVLHFRSNLLLVFTWLLLALMISGQIGNIFGIKYLFLSPEYLGDINFFSFFIVGFWFGGFMMSWNLTTYLLDAHRFPFIATMAKPYTMFCINNFVVPLAFFVFYFCHIVYFQGYYELQSFENIMWNCGGFLLGALLLISFLTVYECFS